jgi:hypothetical protein
MELLEVERVEEVLDRALVGGLPGAEGPANGRAKKLQRTKREKAARSTDRS